MIYYRPTMAIIRDTLHLIAKQSQLQEIGRLANVCYNFNIWLNTPSLWHSFLARDFQCECPADLNPKLYYEMLVERERIIRYAIFELNPPQQEQPTYNPWAFIAESKTVRSHAVTALRDQLTLKKYRTFAQLTDSYLANAQIDHLDVQKADIVRMLNDLIFSETAVAVLKMNELLNGLHESEVAQRRLDPNCEIRKMCLLLSILSKCDAKRLLQCLLIKLTSEEKILRKFYRAFGTQLCLDAILYHRMEITRLLLPTTLSDMQVDLPIHHEVVSGSPRIDDYIEDKYVQPLALALNMLATCFNEITKIELVTAAHDQSLTDVIEMIERICAAGASSCRMMMVKPDNMPIGTEMRTIRDYAHEILATIRHERRMEETLRLRFESILEFVIALRSYANDSVQEIVYTEDHFSDFDSHEGGNLTSDAENGSAPTTPTKKLRGLSLQDN